MTPNDDPPRGQPIRPLASVSRLCAALLAVAFLGCGSAGPDPIGTVQGAGATSPLAGEVVTVEGVVVAAPIEGLGGLYLQDAPGEEDGDPGTSDAIFVEWAELGVPVAAPGDRVAVTGTVVELGEGSETLTALRDVEVVPLGEAERPPAVELDAPPPDWEAYEGMPVTISAPLTVSGTYSLARFGEVVASFGGRLVQPTEVASSGAEARSVAEENARRRLLLDDADTRPIDAPPGFLPSGWSADRPFRTGSVVRGATGILDQRRGEHRLQILESIESQVEQAPRPAVPMVPGDLRIAGLNVLNLFNGDGAGGGFPTSRGAETVDGYRLQQQKLVSTVQAMAPDVLALMEIENDGYGPRSSIAAFVTALNAAGPATDYRAVSTGSGPGSDPIRVALVYRAGRVEPTGLVAVLEGGPFEELSRVPIAAAFRPLSGGDPLVVVANHFKSKGCGSGEDAARGAEADQGDGQGCWNPTRVESAERLNAWLETDPTGAGTDRVALLGDLNAYAEEDPVRVLRGAGWRDAFAVTEVGGAYTYVYDGAAGRLDHALLSPALAERLTGVAVWHSNADELSHFDYRNGADPGPYRASDHDPILLGFDAGS